ncbi:MAG: hypothetical protein KJZ78_07065 [Bryobacteraceae bacterium]|nr:hypothetical protein [Bryobacteraceae bacterium]HEU0142980.1 hypothetical protein [Bryobacteraceae bacterium]
MMEPAYPAARAAAASVHAHFARHAAAPAAGEGKPASLPDRDAIEAIIDTAFWASLRHEEGFSPRISLAFVTPAEVERALHFERALPLAARPLTRLAPAVEGPGIHLGVWREREDLRVWGTTRRLPPFCFVLEVVAPGLLVVKQSRGEETGKFVNVAVLEGEQIKIIDQHAATLPDCPDLLTSLLGLEARFAPDGASNVLIQIAVSMRAHGRGGLLLVVPAGSDAWRKSIIHPVTYSIVPPFSVLADLMQEDPGERPKRRWQDALRRAVDGIGGVTAVDGATVITDQYELLAFGAKIVRRPGSNQVDRVLMTEPIIGAAPEILEPTQLGGTRHISAAQFEHDQRDAVALVASQDGRFTVFAWSPCENMVHAHRIESLLL